MCFGVFRGGSLSKLLIQKHIVRCQLQGIFSRTLDDCQASIHSLQSPRGVVYKAHYSLVSSWNLTDLAQLFWLGFHLIFCQFGPFDRCAAWSGFVRKTLYDPCISKNAPNIERRCQVNHSRRSPLIPESQKLQRINESLDLRSLATSLRVEKAYFRDTTEGNLSTREIHLGSSAKFLLRIGSAARLYWPSYLRPAGNPICRSFVH